MSRPVYFASGSGVERIEHCLGPLLLPHTRHETPYSERGTVLHRFIEDVINSDLESALAAVPEEWRAVAEQLDLSGLDQHLQLAAEVALAYNVVDDTARELGRGVGRAYDDVTFAEVPTTLDLIGMRPVKVGTRGLVVDWKFGWTTHRRVDQEVQPWQLRFGALAASRAFGLDIVEVQLVHVYEGRPPYIQKAVLGGWELDEARDDLRKLHRRASDAILDMQSGQPPDDLAIGPWCQHCPSIRWCPAQMRLVTAVVSPDHVDDLLRMRPLPRAQLGEAWNRIKATESLLRMIKGSIIAAAGDEPIYLGETGDGKHRWIAEVIHQGNEKLDGEVTFEEVERAFGPEVGAEVAAAATKLVATKKDLELAIRKHVPKGQGAKTIRAILDAIRARKGVHRTTSVRTQEIVLKDAKPPPNPRMLVEYAQLTAPTKETDDDDPAPPSE